jgi:heme exporter protein A
MAGYASLPARMLSQGQRRRVALARLFAHQAALWILDEPLAALDSDAIASMQKLMSEQAASGGMVIFTTHQDVVIDTAVQQRIELGSC